MEILYMLIGLSFLLAGGGLAACIWAIKNGQYNDVASPSQKLVFEDHSKQKPTKNFSKSELLN